MVQQVAAFVATLRRLLPKPGGSRFRQNFWGIAKANLLAQMLGLALTPLLTRLYSPSAYGTAALFAALLGFLAAFATLRFEWSIPNAASTAEAAALAWLGAGALAAISTTSLVLWVPCVGGAEFAAKFQGLAEFRSLLPLALLGAGIQQIMLGWFTRENSLAAVGRAQIQQSIAGSALNIAGGLGNAGPWGLITSATLSAWTGLPTLWRNARELCLELRTPSVAALRHALREFAAESAVSTAVSILNVASLSTVPFLLASYYGAAPVGWYALMNRVALAPSQVLTSALSRSFWSEAARLAKTDLPALRRLYITTARHLALASLPVALLCVAGSRLVVPIFGPEWRGAGALLLALVPAVVTQLIAQPITHLIVHRKQHWKLYLDAGRLAAIVGGTIFLAGRNVEIHYVVWWLSGVHAMANAVLFCLNLRCFLRPQISR